MRPYICCMQYDKKTRKEVLLDKETIESLQVLASKKDWSLKKYMEYVLISHAAKNSAKLYIHK
jgi:hypothetical protein